MKVAYLMSRFPKLSETFVLLEALEVRRAGVEVVIFPLLHYQEWNVHTEALDLEGSIFRSPYLSLEVLRANLWFLRRKPVEYIRTLARVLTGRIRPRANIFKTLVVFPKTVYFAKMIKRFRCDWVHAHFATIPSTAAWIIYRLTGIPYSFIAHGSDIHANQHLLALKLSDAACAFTISEYNKRFMTWQTCATWSGTLSVLHCGVYPADYEKRLKQPLSTRGVIRILSVGSLLEVKGHRYLIEACSLLGAKGVDFLCEIIGEGPLLSELKLQISNSNLRQRIVLAGGMSRDAVRGQLAQADIFVLPSVRAARGSREGIPVALMEAMAAGLPVVASRLSGIPELVEDGRSGLLVMPRHSSGLARAIERILSDPDGARRMAQEASEVVKRDFNLEITSRQLIARWEGALSAVADEQHSGQSRG
ncbi:MAG: colanic acid biosynthesis glycosyltransferase WcaL [Halochromatium sp.]|nr:colanic acid biosynthesis glycosyltransferase WcaL [Halochromatium sp.]